MLKKGIPAPAPKHPQPFEFASRHSVNHPLSSAKGFAEQHPPQATSQQNLALKRLGLEVRCLVALRDAMCRPQNATH